MTLPFVTNFEGPAGAPKHGPAKHKRPRGAGVSMWSRDNEYLRKLRLRLERRGDFAAAETAIAAQVDVNDRAYVVEACADWASPQAWIDGWARQSPESSAMLLVRGVNRLISGWSARGVGWVPSDVGGFWEYLRLADADLARAAQLRPQDAVPWAFMIGAAKGLELSKEEQGRRFKEAVRRDPALTQAYTAMLSALCAKWGGSHDEMFRFARQATARAAAGSTIHALIAEAHLEFAGAAAREHGQSAAAAYWRDPEVLRELRAAAERCFQGIGRRGRNAHGRSSIDHSRAAIMLGATLDSCGDHRAGDEFVALLR